MVREYVYFVRDDRRDAPVQRRVRLHGYEEACRLAERILRETYHHLSVEMWSEGKPLLTVETGGADAA